MRAESVEMIGNGAKESVTGQRNWNDFAHTGPGTLAGRYLRRFWHPIYRMQDLPAGRAKPVRIMSEDLTLYRGERGAVHLVAFRCAHRGTQLSTGWVEGDEIRCFYHGWKYDGTGHCTEQPAEPEPFCNRIKIRSYPVREYLGLVFAYLGEDEPPAFRQYPELEQEGVIANATYTWPCNYFSSLENGIDHAHTSFVHRRAGTFEGVPIIDAVETEFGLTQFGHHSDGGVREVHHMMPNLQYRRGGPPVPGAAWTHIVVWRMPVDDEHLVSFSIELCPVTGEVAEQVRQRIARLEATPNPAPELAEKVLREGGNVDALGDLGPRVTSNVQDYVAQVGQDTIPDRRLDHLGRSDAALALLRALWRRELRALAEGRPLTQWRQPEHLEASIGIGAA